MASLQLYIISSNFLVAELFSFLLGNTNIKSLVTDSQVPKALHIFYFILFSLFYRLVIYIHLYSSLPIFFLLLCFSMVEPQSFCFPVLFFFSSLFLYLYLLKFYCFLFILRIGKIRVWYFLDHLYKASLKASIDISLILPLCHWHHVIVFPR